MGGTRDRFDVAVVGAGVFGAWIAWHLVRAGKQVLLIDKYGPANARASSGGETRAIRAAYGPNEIYTRMSRRALALWKEFFAQTGHNDLFRQTGVLWLSLAGDDAALQSVETLARLDIRHEVLDAAELARRYPRMTVPDGGWAILEPESGVLLARRAVQAVVDDACHAGAELRLDEVAPPAGSGRLAWIETRAGARISADHFVFACGPWLGTVLPAVLGGRIFPTRQEVYYFGVPAAMRSFVADALPIWLDFGRDYYGFPDLDGRGFKLGFDRYGEPIDPDLAERAPTPARIAQAREFLALRFPVLAGAPLLGAEVCQYETTSNGDFVLDRHPAFDNVWIAGGGSGHGFKHGPAVGEYVAQRVLRGGSVEPRFSLATKGTTQRREVH